jgi:hypothetical protein
LQLRERPVKPPVVIAVVFVIVFCVASALAPAVPNTGAGWFTMVDMEDVARITEAGVLKGSRKSEGRVPKQLF